MKRARVALTNNQHQSIAAELVELLEGWPELQTLASPKSFLDRMARFATALSRWGSRANLTAAPQSSRNIFFHTVDSLSPLWAADEGGGKTVGGFENMCRAIDIGSGAGFPGLILAAATPAHFTLIEARRKRASFLTVAAAEMGLENVTVRWGRAEMSADAKRCDVITSRAVRVSRETLDLAAAILSKGGRAIFYMSQAQASEQTTIASRGLAVDRICRYQVARGRERVTRALIVMHSNA